MSRWKVVTLIVFVCLISALVAGGIGAAMATVLVTQFAEQNRPSPSDAPDSEDRELASAVLGETRRYTVHLPDFYARDTDMAYPVWVVLDGDTRGPESAEVARTFERAGIAPGHLVVAVDNVPRGRTQDMLPPGLPEPVDGTTGGADRFLAFLETELIPEVDSLYRTTDVHLLSGHSFGGVFAAYALVERPELFDAVFAFSPSLWATGGELVSRAESLASSLPQDVFLYLNIGDERGEMRNRFDQLEARLAEIDTAPLRWQAEIMEGASHGATPRLGSPVALRAFWSER